MSTASRVMVARTFRTRSPAGSMERRSRSPLSGKAPLSHAIPSQHGPGFTTRADFYALATRHQWLEQYWSDHPRGGHIFARNRDVAKIARLGKIASSSTPRLASGSGHHLHGAGPHVQSMSGGARPPHAATMRCTSALHVLPIRATLVVLPDSQATTRRSRPTVRCPQCWGRKAIGGTRLGGDGRLVLPLSQRTGTSYSLLVSWGVITSTPISTHPRQFWSIAVSRQSSGTSI